MKRNIQTFLIIAFLIMIGIVAGVVDNNNSGVEITPLEYTNVALSVLDVDDPDYTHIVNDFMSDDRISVSEYNNLKEYIRLKNLYTSKDLLDEVITEKLNTNTKPKQEFSF